MDKEFNGHAYYGDLITLNHALELYDDGEYVISTNGIQGDDGRQLLEDLQKFDIDVFVDYDGDQADTVFFTIDHSKTTISQVLGIMDIVFESKPDEFSHTNQTTYRIWWD